jgi:hypothetical protein
VLWTNIFLKILVNVVLPERNDPQKMQIWRQQCLHRIGIGHSRRLGKPDHIGQSDIET